MTTDTENGATWTVRLWMDNDEGYYTHWTDRAEYLLENSETPTVDLADEMRYSIEDEKEGLAIPTSMFTDLLWSALCSVDWQAIAEGYIETAKEAEEA